jgi:hypothetical protein
MAYVRDLRRSTSVGAGSEPSQQAVLNRTVPVDGRYSGELIGLRGRPARCRLCADPAVWGLNEVCFAAHLLRRSSSSSGEP